MSLQREGKGVRDYLRDYILFQVEQGYESSDIKELLLSHGYKKGLVDGIFSEIGSLPARKKKTRGKKKMSKDLFSYLAELIVDFIIKEKEQGYSNDAIRKALINYGHSEKLVDAAIKSVENSSKIDIDDLFEEGKRSAPRKTGTKDFFKLPPLVIYALSVAFILGFIVFLSAITDAYVIRVLVSFLPVIITISVNYVVVLQFKSRGYLNLVPFFMVILTIFIFLGVLQTESYLVDIAQPEVVVVLNAVLAFILSSVLCFFSRWPHMGENVMPWDKLPVEEDENISDAERELQEGDEKLEKILSDYKKNGHKGRN